MNTNDYDPIGGHTEEEAAAAYEALFRELHGHGTDEREGGSLRNAGAPEIQIVTPIPPSFDTECAAKAYARLKNICHPSHRRSNPESTDVSTPDETNALIIIGSTDPALLPPGIAEANIIEIIDNKPLAGLKTRTAPICHIRPAAAVSTIVYELYQQAGAAIDNETAALLCTAITKATKKFTAPETTQPDKLAALALANQSQTDLNTI